MAASYVPSLTFDVASVRENKTIDATAGYSMGAQFAPNSTSVRLMNWDIENLVSFAYGVDRNQVQGFPTWPRPTLFVVEAKGDGEADVKFTALSEDQQKAERRHMLQALLEERFGLKTHRQTKEADVYHLVVAKNGPMLGKEGSMPPSAEELQPLQGHALPPLHQKNDGQGYDFIAHGVSMPELARTLTGQFGRPVLDRTALTDKYDFILRYKGRWDRDRNPDDLDPMPPMDRALQEQLGLKVEPAKGPVEFLVIDQIAKPSEN